MGTPQILELELDLELAIHIALPTVRGGSGTSQMGPMGATIPAGGPGATICS